MADPKSYDELKKLYPEFRFQFNPGHLDLPYDISVPPAKPGVAQYQEAMRQMSGMMQREAQAKKEAEKFKSSEGPVMVLDIPIFLCPECGYQFDCRPLEDGIRLRFRHEEVKHCSKSMTEFIRPKAHFCREI